MLSAYISHFAADVSCTYPSSHQLVPVSITKYGVYDGSFDEDGSLEIEGVDDGEDDIDGSLDIEIEGFDDGVDDHDEVKGSQMCLRNSRTDPVGWTLK